MCDKDIVRTFNTVLNKTPQAKCLLPPQHQRCDSDLDRAHQDIANLNQKLCHARRNLEDEKRKRRSTERYRNLLVR